MADLWILRGIVVLAAAGLLLWMRPGDLHPALLAVLGAVVGAALILAEHRLREARLGRLLGAAVGAVVGVTGAYVIGRIIESSIAPPMASPLQLLALLGLGYVGAAVGASKGELLNLGALDVFRSDSDAPSVRKILDTSVIIDGRIADIAESGFLDGAVIIPQFVLWELQTVADSSDGMKRNRGRRGLDILQKIQKMKNLDIQILENDFPKLKEVDQKLVELAKELDGKIVTNDFNLNKLAELQGVRVLNINELANALKPVVLPGEIMQVFVLKEGKEYNQGVAYLDDGTMVVIDNARDQISNTIEVSVTSVLQTTAGKMIFGRYEQQGGSAPSSSQGSGQGSASSRPRTAKSSGQMRAYAAPRSGETPGNPR